MALHTGKDLPLPGANFVVDGYLGGTRTVMSNQHHVNLFSGPERLAFLDEDVGKNEKEKKRESETKSTKKTIKNSTTLMKEYNHSYSGLMLLPWTDFVKNPRKLNDLFHLEKTGFITFDPDEVNVFFHAKRMEKPVLGDVGESGKAWVINVEKLRDIEAIRTSLIDKISIFGLTLLRTDKASGREMRVPCLLMLDPSHGNIGEQIQRYLNRCVNIMQENGNFSLEINFNGCVERWCRRITNAKSKCIGARLIITNGEEKDTLASMENIICCIACFPIWLIQTAIYKIYRSVSYQDIELDFSAEEVLLYGTVGGVQNQRDAIFNGRPETGVFYTSPTAPPPEDVGHKYVTQKKSFRRTQDDVIQSTSTIPSLLNQERFDNRVKRLELIQDECLEKETKTMTSQSVSSEDDLVSENKMYDSMAKRRSVVSKNKVIVDIDHHADDRIVNLANKNYFKTQGTENVENSTSKKKKNDKTSQNSSADTNEEDSVQIISRKYRMFENDVSLDDSVEDNTVQSVSIQSHGQGRIAYKPKQQEEIVQSKSTPKSFDNAGYESDDTDSGNHVEYLPTYPLSNKMDHSSQKTKLTDDYSVNARGMESKVHGNNSKVDASAKVLENTQQGGTNVSKELKGEEVVSEISEVDDDSKGSLFTHNATFKHRRLLSQGLIGGNQIENLRKQESEDVKNVIPVNRAEQTSQLDTTNPDITDMETDMDLSDLETDSDSEESLENTLENSSKKENDSPFRNTSARRRPRQYDSRRKYLSAQLPRRNIKSPPINRPPLPLPGNPTR